LLATSDAEATHARHGATLKELQLRQSIVDRANHLSRKQRAVKMTDAIELVRHILHLLHSARAGRLSEHDSRTLCEIVSTLGGHTIIEPRPITADEVAFRPLHNPPLRGDRCLNTLDFAALSLMSVAGARIVADTTTSEGKLYSYLRYEHPTDISDDMRIRVNRIIINAPPEQAVGFVDRKAFRNYCRDNLKLRKPIAGMQDPKLGREAAIKLARSLYEATSPASLSYLSAEGYEALLREVFATADHYHAGAFAQ
jgi:hypothetical protein